MELSIQVINVEKHIIKIWRNSILFDLFIIKVWLFTELPYFNKIGNQCFKLLYRKQKFIIISYNVITSYMYLTYQVSNIIGYNIITYFSINKSLVFEY